MSSDDEVQIVSVTNPRRKRRRAAAADDVEMLYVENLPSIDIPEIIRVELPRDDSVMITGVSEADIPSKSCKETQAEELKVEETKVEKRGDEPTPARKTQAEPEVPVYWTKCQKCRRSTERRYHLVDVSPNTHEWLNVCSLFLNVDFTVHRLARIQNQSLWRRMQCERQLICRSRPAGFDLNERLLYHTSRAKTEVICAEGLDQRLGAVGSFGRGIYFSDNPRKCDSYWQYNSQLPTKKMFACRVLLGDIKVYAAGRCDQSLVREPAKPGRRGHQTYDSVLGNKGFNEFVVYNTYRVMPEYVIEYQSNGIPPPQVAGVAATNPCASRPSLPMCHVCGDLTTVCRCSRLSN